MKHVNQVMAMISHLNEAIIVAKHEHAKLNQIDMLSGEGHKLRERINKLKGMRFGLEWIINDNDLTNTSDVTNDME